MHLSKPWLRDETLKFKHKLCFIKPSFSYTLFILSFVVVVVFFSDSGGSYTYSAHSFIFSFKNKDNLDPFKVLVKTLDHGIYGNNGHGPTFGGGHDIHISNNANGNRNSYSNLGHSYVQPPGYTYGSSKIRDLLAGSYKFQPNEVEVFYQSA